MNFKNGTIMKKNIVYLIVLGIALQACQSNEPTTTETKAVASEAVIVLNKSQLSNIPMSIINIEERSLGKIIRANGSIDVPPQSLVNISAPFGGYLKYTELLPGLKVRKGELLAVLEDQQYIQMGQDFLSAKNKMELAKIDFKKQKELYAEKAIAEKTYLESKSNMEILEIQVHSYGEKLKLIGIDPQKFTAEKISSRMEIHSPIDGYISKVNVNVGKYISSNDVLFELINPNDIHLNIQIFQKDIPYIAVGQKVVAFTNEHPDVKYNAEIILVGRGLNENKAIDVHCHFEKEDHQLIPGMFMNVEVESALKKSMVVKESSVIRYENKNYLVVAQNDSTFELYPVTTGVSEKPYIEIIDPSEELKQAKIIDAGSYKILMAMKNKSEE